MNELNDDSNLHGSQNRNSRVWWNAKRIKYNIGLLIAGLAAFILYIILNASLTYPHDKTFEITFFTTVLQIVAYLFMMLLANIFYGLGYFFDIQLNKKNSDNFRKKLFNLGFWFSVALPFLIPLWLVLEYITQ